MKNVISKIVMCFALLLLIAGCGKQDGSSAPVGVVDSGVASLGLSSDKDTINSDGVEQATLTVRALDANNAAVEGIVVSLSVTAGALSQSSVTTDASGSATFTLDSGVETNNQVVTVTASSGTAVTTKAVTIRGTTVTFTTNRSSVGLNGASTATITVQVRDGSGVAVDNVPLTLTTSLGTVNGVKSLNLTTNASGLATATYEGLAAAGIDTITLSGPGTASLQIVISGQQFSLADTQAGSFSISSSDTLTLTWIDASGTAIAGGNVFFSCSKCTFDLTGNSFVTGVTDAGGQMTTVIHPTTVGDDTITVVDDDGNSLSSTLDVTIFSDTPDTVTLSINPSVVSRDQGGATPTSIIRATVLDDQDRAVQGVQVAFSLISGPGGGESVSPAIATTNAAGIATTTFFSGGQISAQGGVTVLAKVVSAPTIAGSETLTIANQAATIIIGGSNEIGTLNVGDAEVYSLPFTVLVTDTNGSAIANQVISLSLYPSFFRTGVFLDNADADTFNPTGTFANEDVNKNGILDTGEDSVIVNGRLDPGGVASIPFSVTTDENGFAGFNVVYPKAYGWWVDVEISATTNVSGTESKAVLGTVLAIEDGDSPYLDSPFGP